VTRLNGWGFALNDFCSLGREVIDHPGADGSVDEVLESSII
jgi:hypothetical protein